MRKQLTLSALLIQLSVLTSCTEVLDLKLDEDSEKVVIESLITNQLQPFQVKLSKTISLNSDEDFPTINNAFVTIADNQGNLDTLQPEGNGIYKTTTNKQGVIGRTYYLTVTVNNINYVAEDKLLVISPIDSLYFLYRETGDELGIREDGYYAYFNSSDPPNEKNYYLYEVFRNGKSVLASNQVGVFDDKFLAPQIIYSRLPGKFESQDKLLFKFYSISEKAYEYYNGVALQLQNDGGFFGTPPANAKNNLSNGALGFFQTSALNVDSLIAP